MLAEDLLLLYYDDDTGKPVLDSTKVDYSLAGAVLVELSMRGKVGVAGDGERVRSGRLIVRDPEPTGDTVLDSALRVVRDKEGGKPKDVLGKLRKGLRESVLQRLADSGRLRRTDHRVLGLFPTPRWPVADPGRKTHVRGRLREVLIDGHEPDESVVGLIALLAAVDAVPKFVPSDDKRATKRRAKEIAEGQWAGHAVRKAVQEVQAAVTGAVAAAGVAASNGGG
ncbi:Golgi phosphoprotein 3 GPP34 [Haloactinopolyspora alba]|uniref:Golgi phosphoprotein 3 GPP34 n=1 Tax=Haloactinopolyspora alba TaxID=648780 RepID=A0A2P8DY98_9ACTN|nr:GPP34 family phosphoprotein [Haloactinopolyspora alba]PSL02198.1 Golgi phosphoprotein 3 GPP34 [Haloactinopolyspora alba]